MTNKTQKAQKLNRKETLSNKRQFILYEICIHAVDWGASTPTGHWSIIVKHGTTSIELAYRFLISDFPEINATVAVLVGLVYTHFRVLE